LEEVARRAKSYGLEVVMINVWEHLKAQEEAQHFCSVHKLTGPAVLLDTEGEYMHRLGLRGVPMNIVVNKKGIVQAVGVTTPDEVRSTLTKLLLPFG
jgi:hypothetical protein